MINILTSKTIFHKEYAKKVLTPYIRPESKICVIAFSHFESNDMLNSYYKTYEKPLGIWYLHIVEPLLTYGIPEDQIEFVLYKKDSKEDALKKIQEADILFLPGGAPDKFMERLKEYELLDALKSFDGIIMGPSAGTMIQFNWFHISKDRDYKKYSINSGIGYLNDFGVEVHYNRRKQQKKSIRRVSHYHDRPVYVIEETGLMILKDGKIIFQKDAYKYYEKGKKVYKKK